MSKLVFNEGDLINQIPQDDGIIKIELHNGLLSPFNLEVEENLTKEAIITITAATASHYDLNFTVGANSFLNLYVIIENMEAITINQTINALENATINVVTTHMSGAKTNGKYVYNLLGKNSVINLNMIAMANEATNQTIDVLFNHQAQYTSGDIKGVAIASDEARLKIATQSQINQGMNGASAFQNVRGIILSDHATLEIDPILLIDEYDVKAGHGATIGKVDDEVLYYLMSRGLTKESATKLMINGFINPAVMTIPDETIRNHILNMISERM